MNTPKGVHLRFWPPFSPKAVAIVTLEVRYGLSTIAVDLNYEEFMSLLDQCQLVQSQFAQWRASPEE